MMNRNKTAFLALALALVVAAPIQGVAQEKSTPAKPIGVLAHPDLEKLIPPSVYFQGQSATVQVRNSGGVRFAGGAIMFAAKVDTGGYSTSIQERYQDYLITETPLLLGEASAAKTLAPGAYGIGFLTDGLLVMDVGGHTLFTVPLQTDATLRRPSPLQVLAHDSGFRLFSGRTYVTFAAAP